MLDRLLKLDDGAGIPMMDGVLRPNQRLDAATPIGEPLHECDDVAVRADGVVFVSAGSRILQLAGEGLRERSTFADCPGPVGPLAIDGDTILAGIAGHGVVRIERGTVVARLEAADGQPLHCPTAIVRLPDHRIAIADGSAHHLPDAWCRDLLERRASGRLVLASADLKAATTRGSGLAWPAGLRVASDDRSLWMSESWRHRLLRVPLDGNGAPTPLAGPLPGYPGRLGSDPRGGAWLAVFALRTQLVEFVLRERSYCDAMLATVDPRYWIAPSLRALGHYLEPLQGGGIKKLGLVKPWAPPRSYGLVLRLSESGESVESLHSRAGGLHHGITAVHTRGDQLVIVSKGHGVVLDAPREAS
jgi:hypothetical protein